MISLGERCSILVRWGWRCKCERSTTHAGGVRIPLSVALTRCEENDDDRYMPDIVIHSELPYLVLTMSHKHMCFRYIDLSGRVRCEDLVLSGRVRCEALLLSGRVRSEVLVLSPCHVGGTPCGAKGHTAQVSFATKFELRHERRFPLLCVCQGRR